MAAQTLDGSLRGSRHLASCLYIHLLVSEHASRVAWCVCVWVRACLCAYSCLRYSGGVDSYRPLNGSNDVKELQCHIHQSLLSVRARQKCWHLNTSRWVKRPFRRQLLDTQACSYRRLVTTDCQVVTRGKRPGCMRGWRGTIHWDLLNERVLVLWGRYSVGTITPVKSGKSAPMEIRRLSVKPNCHKGGDSQIAGCESVRATCAQPLES